MLRLGTSFLALAAVAALSTGCIITDDDGDSDLTIINDSSYVLQEILLAPVGQTTWGPDLLRGDVLLPGESLTIVSIECDTYDVLVQDDTGVDCTLEGLTLCFDSTDWVVTDRDLDRCAFGG